MPYRCPNCGTKLVNYDGLVTDQYCYKCDYYNNQDGKEYNKHKNIWVND